MPSHKAVKKIRHQAAQHGLTFDAKENTLANRRVVIKTAYHGGDVIARQLDGCDIALVQCGADGEWIAVLPLEALLKILESETLSAKSQEN